MCSEWMYKLYITSRSKKKHENVINSLLVCVPSTLTRWPSHAEPAERCCVHSAQHWRLNVCEQRCKSSFLSCHMRLCSVCGRSLGLCILQTQFHICAHRRVSCIGSRLAPVFVSSLCAACPRCQCNRIFSSDHSVLPKYLFTSPPSVSTWNSKTYVFLINLCWFERVKFGRRTNAGWLQPHKCVEAIAHLPRKVTNTFPMLNSSWSHVLSNGLVGSPAVNEFIVWPLCLHIREVYMCAYNCSSHQNYKEIAWHVIVHFRFHLPGCGKQFETIRDTLPQTRCEYHVTVILLRTATGVRWQITIWCATISIESKEKYDPISHIVSINLSRHYIAC